MLDRLHFYRRDSRARPSWHVSSSMPSSLITCRRGGRSAVDGRPYSAWMLPNAVQLPPRHPRNRGMPRRRACGRCRCRVRRPDSAVPVDLEMLTSRRRIAIALQLPARGHDHIIRVCTLADSLGASGAGPPIALICRRRVRYSRGDCDGRFDGSARRRFGRHACWRDTFAQPRTEEHLGEPFIHAGRDRAHVGAAHRVATICNPRVGTPPPARCCDCPANPASRRPRSPCGVLTTITSRKSGYREHQFPVSALAAIPGCDD